MAIVKRKRDGTAVTRRSDLAQGGAAPAAKKGGKKAAKKGAGAGAKKSAGKKSAKHVVKKAATAGVAEDGLRHGWDPEQGRQGSREDGELELAFHHLHRAAAVISLLKEDSGGDLRLLLEHGMDLYRAAASARRKPGQVNCARGLLRAAEHLGMAGLYEARSAYRVHVAPPTIRQVRVQLGELGKRLEELGSPERENAQRMLAMARELVRRAEGAGHDPHLEYELTMAAEGICIALEEGL